MTADGVLDFTSPQLEAGTRPSLYQATDEVLNVTDDYGAWFSRGSIGGTIQHPLLRLNADGSLESRDGSFVINADGTGHFAGGRFRWTKDAIELRGGAQSAGRISTTRHRRHYCRNPYRSRGARLSTMPMHLSLLPILPESRW